MKRLFIIFASLVSVGSIAAENAADAPVVTESRDASAAYIGTANFIVGRMGRECLGLLNRSETPQEYVAMWQKRNARYYAASTTYMSLRLKEAERAGGPEREDKVAAAYMQSVRGDGEASVRNTFSKGEKSDVCNRWIQLIDSGAFDINSNSPMYGELNELVKYFEQ
jgi:hypothetical protein